MNLIKGNYYILYGRYKDAHIFYYNGDRYVDSVARDYRDPKTLYGMDTQLLENEIIDKAYPPEIDFYNKYVTTLHSPDLSPKVSTGSFQKTFVPCKYSVGQVIQHKDLFGKIRDITQIHLSKQPIYSIDWSDGKSTSELQRFVEKCEVSDRLWSEIIKIKKGFRLW